MTRFVLVLALITFGFAATTLAVLHFPAVQAVAQRAAMPGELTQAHAFLGNSCTACHTPLEGIEAKNCVVCHADDSAILEREPSAFHADIGACAECHREHRGPAAITTEMDHTTLARIGLERLHSELPADPARAALVAWLQRRDAPSLAPQLERLESLLNCATCHQTKSPHFGFFGVDCAQCHGTTRWTIPEFRHPSSSSQSCAQCHQAPPSHYMGHFRRISMMVAGQPHAEVSQCFLCHQTTAWNDIRRVGFYKHH